MAHLQLLLAFALLAASFAHAPTHNPYEVLERERERERERENRPWRLDRVREIPNRREGIERERLAERERNVQRERLERERLEREKNILRERLERERLRERLELERIGVGREELYGPGLLQDRRYGYGNEREYGHEPRLPLVPWVDPTKGVLSDGHSGNVELQNKIVRDTYSPTYYQPEYIVDYRFLPSGGRAYTRGRGGQILILPRGVKVDHNGRNSYDQLIEELLREEEHRGRSPLRRILVDGEHQRYGHEGLGERRGEYGYGERRAEYGYGRISREDKEETKIAEPKVEGAEPEVEVTKTT